MTGSGSPILAGRGGRPCRSPQKRAAGEETCRDLRCKTGKNHQNRSPRASSDFVGRSQKMQPDTPLPPRPPASSAASAGAPALPAGPKPCFWHARRASSHPIEHADAYVKRSPTSCRPACASAQPSAAERRLMVTTTSCQKRQKCSFAMTAIDSQLVPIGFFAQLFAYVTMAQTY